MELEGCVQSNVQNTSHKTANLNTLPVLDVNNQEEAPPVFSYLDIFCVFNLDCFK